MIYPATYDITILQNSTWRASLRAMDSRQTLDSVSVVSGQATFNKACHKLLAGDKVIITTDSGATVPCGLVRNSVYFVIASGLTGDTFKVSTTLSGSQISVSGAASGQYYVGKPVDLTGYIIDADMTGLIDNSQVATFVCTSPTPADGEILMAMAPSVSSGIETGRYSYDLSLTSSGGDRYYWLKGVAIVERTSSRN
jgi:magnesium-transporting ATPase (P-type)